MKFNMKNRVFGSSNKKVQKGYTMLELGIAIAVIAVLGGVGLMVVPKMLAENNAKKMSDALTMSIPKIQAAHQNRNNFTGLSSVTVANNGWFSDSMLQKTNGVPTGIITAPWPNGVVTFATTGAGAIQGQVTLTNVPPAVCNSLVDSMLTNDVFQTATINGTSVKALNRDVDFTATGAQCSSTNTNQMVVVFGRS